VISPTPACSCHQIKLEPLLDEMARKVSPRPLRFYTELLDVIQHKDRVEAVIRNRESGEEQTVTARYLIAADGGKCVGPRLGVEMIGSRNLQDNVSLHFTADFSDYVDDGTVLNWIINPGSSSSFGLGSGVVVPVGRGRGSKEWVLHQSFPPDQGDVNVEHAVARMRSLLKIGDIGITVHQLNSWKLESVIADRFRVGRVFFVGDAAHRHPPTIGIGMNSAFGDVSNLVWKLAAVINGAADEALLATYEAERRPVIERNIDCANTTYYSHMLVNVALGLLPGMEPESRNAAFEAFFEDTPSAKRRRARAQRMIREALRSEFQALDLELGYSYTSEAISADCLGQTPPSDPSGIDYTPTTVPGVRLPHAWLSLSPDSAPISTLDLTGALKRFVLLVAANADAWRSAANDVATVTGCEVSVVSIGEGGDYQDIDGRWAELSQVGPNGAVLVRPDNHVAWRGVAFTDADLAAFRTALKRALSHTLSKRTQTPCRTTVPSAQCRESVTSSSAARTGASTPRS
jgi:2,4-dichlorophenol 6-monooxygenase